MTLLNLGMELWHALVIERHLAADQDVQHNTKTPDVDLRASVLFGLEKFGGGKVQTSTECLELIPRREQVTQSKVNNLDVAHLADKDVLNLEISVDDAVPVAVVQGAGNLSSELARLLFLEAAVGDDVVEHLSTIDELEHHVPVEVCAHDILHAADVGMVQQTDNGSLSGGSDFFGVIGSFAVGGALMLVLGLSRNDLDGGLLTLTLSFILTRLRLYSCMPLM